jgi:isoquinoline 1-oxidoreductase beta subunit
VKSELYNVNAKSRRQFLMTAAAATPGIVIGFYLPDRKTAFATKGDTQPAEFAPNAFLKIGSDNIVEIISKHIEVGQGIYTGLATILAEELDASWSQVHVTPAPADDNPYRNLRLGMQMTCCSNSTLNSFEQYRRAGAMARAMLVTAAARRWQVPADALTVDNGIVKHLSSSRQATFGDLAAAAKAVSPPVQVTLKDPKNFKLIGAEHLTRVDSKEKSNGRALFPIDVSLPELVFASVERPRRFGAQPKSFDAFATKSMQDVIDVVSVSGGIAVVAKSFPAALQGRKALMIEWDDSKCESRGTPELLTEYRALLDMPGAVARRDGDVSTALAGAARVLTADYEFPYLAHVPMEPDSVVVRLSAGRCEIWTYDPAPTSVQRRAARITGLRPDQVQVNTMYGGGSFGGGGGGSDTAVEIAHAIGGRFPVKLIETREDMMRGDEYRPMYVHRLAAGLDSRWNLIAWHHRIVGQSIFAGQPGYVTNGVDIVSVGGASNIPYDIPNILVDLHTTTCGIPVATWRSAGDSHTAFAVETFLDDVAHAAGVDPFEFRRRLLGKDPREKKILEFAADRRFQDSLFAKFPRDLRVLELAAGRADWGRPLQPGKGRGIAVHYSFRTSVAHVAEVSVETDGSVRVERVVCAIDCGLPINPDVIRAQVEGGVAFGLSSILHEQITVNTGAAEQSNFNDYRLLRIDEMPTVEVHIVPSQESPTGIGEPVVPTVGPAVANAIFAATGKRFRNPPFTKVAQDQT